MFQSVSSCSYYIHLAFAILMKMEKEKILVIKMAIITLFASAGLILAYNTKTPIIGVFTSLTAMVFNLKARDLIIN